MTIENTITSLKKKGYQVSHFFHADEAVAYLKSSLHGKTIGFGGSQILTELDLRLCLLPGTMLWSPTSICQALKRIKLEENASRIVCLF